MTADDLYNIAMDAKKKRLEHVLWSQRELDEWYNHLIFPKLLRSAELGYTQHTEYDNMNGEHPEVIKQMIDYLHDKKLAVKIDNHEEGTQYIISFGLNSRAAN